MTALEHLPPLCPACGNGMTLARVHEREYLGHELHTYECPPCRVSYTVGVPDAREGGHENE